MLRSSAGAAGLACLVLIAGCQPKPAGVGTLAATLAASHENAEEFVARVEAQLTPLQREQAAATWTQLTYITPDTQLLNARGLEYFQPLTQWVAEQNQGAQCGW
jgi:hypothetical protein